MFWNLFCPNTSKILHNPWINLKIELHNETLQMKLMNGKKERIQHPNGRKGTGIDNVKARLELLYKGKHDLQISEEEDVFVVNLRIELTKMNSADPELLKKVEEYA